MRYIHVRLTEKPTEQLQGIDLSRSRVGDLIVVTPHTALRLIAEGLAVEAPVAPVQATRVIYEPSRAAAS